MMKLKNFAFLTSIVSLSAIGLTIQKAKAVVIRNDASDFAYQDSAIDPYNIYNNLSTDYARYRPGYPSEAIDSILDKLYCQSTIIADIGAGTGIGSCLLAQQGVKVYAVEPNDDMRESSSPYPLVEFYKGTSENTNLENASVNLITCFQSYHWFNQQRTLIEFLRILKPEGRLALVWNQWDVSDEFTAFFNSKVNNSAFSNPLKRHLENLKTSIAPSNFLKPWQSLKLFFFLRWFNFTNIRRLQFSHTQELDLHGLISLAMSLAYVPSKEELRQQLTSDLTDLYQRYCDRQGKVRLVYGTSVYLAEISRGEK
jgi:SAM-dependent methyltransferase